MKSFTNWVGAVAASFLLAGAAAGADAIVLGTVKTINPASKQFILADATTGKDVTIKLGTDVLINRGGEVSKSDLKAGDKVNVCHDSGTFTWTARYILVQEGDTKDCVLMCGTVKSYAPESKQLVFTDAKGKDLTFAMNGATVRLNAAVSKIEDVKIGDTCIAVVNNLGGKETLKSLVVERSK